jgi:hypothetical protein
MPFPRELELLIRLNPVEKMEFILALLDAQALCFLLNPVDQLSVMRSDNQLRSVPHLA